MNNLTLHRIVDDPETIISEMLSVSDDSDQDWADALGVNPRTVSGLREGTARVTGRIVLAADELANGCILSPHQRRQLLRMCEQREAANRRYS